MPAKTHGVRFPDPLTIHDRWNHACAGIEVSVAKEEDLAEGP